MTTGEPANSTRIPFSRWRKGLVHMVEASNTIPQFWVEREVSTADVQSWRRGLAHPPSFTDLLVAACGEALIQVPETNSRFGGDAWDRCDEVNVGILLPVEDALVAPGIRHVPRLSLNEIAVERRRLQRAVVAARLSADSLTSATFTLSNLGPFGVTRFQALLLPPQAAVLAVGAARSDGMMSLVLTVDHRTVDGIGAARFLEVVSDLLAGPDWFSERLEGGS